MDLNDDSNNPWESLEIDETDISATSLPPLRRCNNRQPPPSPPPTTATRRFIPGPAGAVQAAMHRTTLFDPLASPVSTQEFIRRVEEDSGEEFRRNPWRFALEDLRKDGVYDTTPLRDVKKCVSVERFNKVIAIVKSCTPNGLGDMKITLKDPTDTIDATVHSKALNVGEFGKLIAVDSVLILQKVVAFSFSRTCIYLNITVRNISKVISADCEVHKFPEVYSGSTPALSGNSTTPEKTSTLVSGRTERVFGNENWSSSMRGKSLNAELAGKEQCVLPSQNRSRQIVNVTDKILDEPLHIDLIESCHRASDRHGISQGDNSGRTSQLGPGSLEGIFRTSQLGPGHGISQGDNSGRTSQLGSGSLEGIFRNLQDLDNEVRPKARECSSAPSLIEKLGSRNRQANGAQAERLLQGNNSNVSTAEKFKTVVMPKNPNDLDICEVDDGRKQPEHRAVNSSAPCMVENLAKRNIFELTGGTKSTQMAVDGGNSKGVAEPDDPASKGANGVKKQRQTLITRTAVHEWTDEQLCILDMDED